MAEQSGFFKSITGDRKYKVDFLAEWVHSFIGNGAYDGNLAVAAGENMAITIPAGRAWINGYYYHNDDDLVIPIANADGVLKRKDTVILRWDINTRSITAQVLTGTFSSSPVAPQITRGIEQYDLKLAEIDIPAGMTAVSQANITDTRLQSDVCGIVTQTVTTIDTTTFYNQISADLAKFKATEESEFQEWFQNVQDTLSGDEAGNLLNLINGKAAKSTTKAATLTASGWSGAIAPYSQTVAVDGVTATSANEILPSASITADQLSALQGANLQDGGQEAGSITLLAYGDKPLIDIPIRVIIRGDL